MQDAEPLLKLLVLTWAVDGKTRSQVHAMLRAANVPADVVERALELYDGYRVSLIDSVAVCAVRHKTGAALVEAKVALRKAAGDVAVACLLVEGE